MLLMQDIAIVEPVLSSDSPSTGSSSDGSISGDLEPQHCVLLRAGGQMSVLDMAQGLKSPLTHTEKLCVRSTPGFSQNIFADGRCAHLYMQLIQRRQLVHMCYVD